MSKTKSLAEEFREIRRVATPWCCIATTDYRLTIKELLKVRVNGEESPPAAVWTQCDGPMTLQGEVSIGDVETPPFLVLKNAVQSLPKDGILFWVVADDFTMSGHGWTNPFTIQAFANVRDEFKANRRTLVVLSIDGKLPSLFTDDVPLLRDPLPDEADLVGIANAIIADVNRVRKERDRKPIKIGDDKIVAGAKLCRGMTRFAAEEAISRNITKDGIDLDSLATVQRLVIEQSSERALTFADGAETYDDIGGLDNIKKFMARLFKGKRAPTVIVRLEEIEKQMSGMSGGGRMGDSTGTSDDQLGILLSAMEDNGWDGLLAPGHAGTGKSHFSKATANTFGIKAINMDLGAAKSKWLGDSEHRIRKMVDILKSFAGSSAFFIATSNDITNIPPALRRRFRSGVFFFDLPTPEERKSIWKINLKRYGIDADQPRPNDDDFTGSDIRNICDLADRLCCSLVEASEYVIPVAKSDPEAVARLRGSAHGKYLSASEMGAYKKPAAATGRAMVI